MRQYKRVKVFDGKHGPGDYRVEFNGAAPTHGEMVMMMWWIFRSEDRYLWQDNSRILGRRLLWWFAIRAFWEEDTIEDLVEQADGAMTQEMLAEARRRIGVR